MRYRWTTADVTDRAGALAMFDENRSDLSQVQKVLVDGGYPESTEGKRWRRSEEG